MVISEFLLVFRSNDAFLVSFRDIRPKTQIFDSTCIRILPPCLVRKTVEQLGYQVVKRLDDTLTRFDRDHECNEKTFVVAIFRLSR